MPQLGMSQRDTTLAALRRAQARLDQLIAGYELGPRNQAHVDAFEEQAQQIGAMIVAAFRAPQRGPVVTPGRRGGVWVR